jgi:hypothetical protein
VSRGFQFRQNPIEQLELSAGAVNFGTAGDVACKEKQLAF